jgi:hypothetical protein
MGFNKVWLRKYRHHKKISSPSCHEFQGSKQPRRPVLPAHDAKIGINRRFLVKDLLGMVEEELSMTRTS